MKSSSWLATLIRSIERLYPRSLSDLSWDNTGLLLESPVKNPDRKRVLLAIDLTTAVAEEALTMYPPVGAIVAYRECFESIYSGYIEWSEDPIIFNPIKSLTLSDPQQRTLLRLAASGISVYSPHTAMDAAVGGINDWLADGIWDNKCIERTVIRPSESVEGNEKFGNMTGMGRMIRWNEPISISTLVKRIKKHLKLAQIRLALSEKHRREGGNCIYKIGICAGSGGSILRNVHADVLFTGELSHHDILHATEKGSSVILCGHSNTERGFLSCVMKKKLQDVLYDEFSAMQDDQLLLPEVVVSEADKDPLEVV
ncbi:YbgI/family dinuclear metal center protein [Pneumocystis carinii B80]|uniref:YbgI/family dinuclear metal center protein n=1 Tax=Pneumocystis carinii (strain B80) TaxID=1408658 RepID=A0A0W4ZH23_PNEC8|nr:YbgI/family dinuclear metal center protein [Pneumocystis carinii B80]KTW27678.1 YbgI/family dinuclear metal center protein [Pneumocystis carinii B80]